MDLKGFTVSQGLTESIPK